jgi:very-short-patch-repair endonuclease
VLISHLLAQGKRVLVTAHTDRALKEVREKLPAAIRPLAVAVVGASREDMSDLRVAVERIAAMATDHDSIAAEQSIAEDLAAIDELRRRRAALYQRLLEAREREVRVHDIAGYHGTLAAIARQRKAELPIHGWVADYVDRPTDKPPLTNAELQEWRQFLLDDALRGDEPAAGKRLVELSAVVEPHHFADLASAEARAAAEAARWEGLRNHPAFQGVARLDAGDRAAISGHLHALAREIGALTQRREPWVPDALDDVRNGRHPVWLARRTEIAQLIAHTMPLVRALGPVHVRVDGDVAGLMPLATALAAHLEDGGKVKLGPDGYPKVGAFAPRVVKQAPPVFERVRVDGAPPCTPAQARAFLTWAEGDRLLAALDRAWPATVTIPDEDTLQERLQWHITELAQLERVLRLGVAIQQEEQHLVSVGLPQPDWNDPRALQAYTALPDAVAAADAAAAATRPLTDLLVRVSDEERWPDAEPVLTRLLDAVRRRDHRDYAIAHERLTRLHLVREHVRRRDALQQRLDAAAPALAAAIAAAPGDPAWAHRLLAFAQAWTSAVAGTWAAERMAADVNALHGEINCVEDTVRAHVQELAATRAWSHAVAPTRLSRRSRASLEQYAALVRRFGKGTGQYREQRKAEIREALDRCRPAVPVWIMPIYRIADQLRIEPGMFDVVIVDEASQAGLEATFLQYLAPRIVVIGDDKQVSPTAVGVDQQQLRDLGNQYLHDDPFRATWQDPQRSLFDEAKMRFSGMLTLVEHRRCVPEIIGFSNRIAYVPDAVRLIPVRQFGADRLEPIRTVFVRDGYEKGASTSRVNPSEVDAIVDQIKKCIADPRYDGLTMGVISLLGGGQAKAIQNKLLERISPQEFTVRNLQCGDAADFQGAERDVIFLSMVAAPEPGRRINALTAPVYVQRYNVAASRAKDQMWLFHSIDPTTLSNKEDVRFQLLDYCYGVQKRASIDDERAVCAPVPEDTLVTPFQSLFEQRVCNRLLGRGYCVIPQYPVLGYSLDLVVVGAKARLAIECDGDAWHGPDAYQRDMARQRELERCGWRIFRILESEFYLDPAKALAPLWEQLAELDIHPSGWSSERSTAAPEQQLVATSQLPLVLEPEAAVVSPLHAPDPSQDVRVEEHIPDTAHERTDINVPTPAVEQLPITRDAAAHNGTDGPPQTQARSGRLAPYQSFTGSVVPVADARRRQLIDGLAAIVAIEGPVLGHRLHSVYVRASAGQRVGTQIAKALNFAISAAVREGRLVQDDPLREQGIKLKTFRLPGQPPVIPRELGPRTFEQIPPAELAQMMHEIVEQFGREKQDLVFREAMALYGIRRVGPTIRARLQAISPLLRVHPEPGTGG